MTRLDELRDMRRAIDREIEREQQALWRMATLRDDVEEALGAVPPEVAEILRETAAAFELEVRDLFSAERRDTSVCARQVAAWLLRDAGLSYPKAAFVMRRDHTTVMYSVRRVNATPALRQATDTIKLRLSGDHLAAVQTAPARLSTAQPPRPIVTNIT